MKNVGRREKVRFAEEADRVPFKGESVFRGLRERPAHQHTHGKRKSGRLRDLNQRGYGTLDTKMSFASCAPFQTRKIQNRNVGAAAVGGRLQR